MPDENLQRDTIFYDGGCALCHALVRFVVLRDHRQRFEFAPLHGEFFRAAVAPEQQAALPDSIVVRTAQGRLLVRSAAVVYALRELRGCWRLLGGLIAALPARLLDAVYDCVARVRYRVLAPRADFCPAVPPELRSRFRL